MVHNLVKLLSGHLECNANATGPFDGLNLKRERVLLEHASDALDGFLSSCFCLFHNVARC